VRCTVKVDKKGGGRAKLITMVEVDGTGSEGVARRLR
jgi:hypothetical protein